MNNTFSTKRCWLLFRKTLLERPVQLFGFTALILAIVLIIYVVCKSQIAFAPAQNISFLWGLAGGGCFLSSFIFSYFSSSANGSSFLTLPASAFEKWLCGVLIAGVLYPLIFLVFFRLMDTAFVTMFHNSLDPASPFYKRTYESVYVLPFDGTFAWKVYPMFIFFSGAMLLGSLYFNKVCFIKVALVICIVCIGGFGLNWLFAKLFFGTINDAVPFRYVTLPVGNEEGSVELPKSLSNFYYYSISYVIPVILWLITYQRLREKEF
jgi:hypothetical protein